MRKKPCAAKELVKNLVKRKIFKNYKSRNSIIGLFIFFISNVCHANDVEYIASFIRDEPIIEHRSSCKDTEAEARGFLEAKVESVFSFEFIMRNVGTLNRSNFRLELYPQERGGVVKPSGEEFLSPMGGIVQRINGYNGYINEVVGYNNKLAAEAKVGEFLNAFNELWIIRPLTSDEVSKQLQNQKNAGKSINNYELTHRFVKGYFLVQNSPQVVCYIQGIFKTSKLEKHYLKFTPSKKDK